MMVGLAGRATGARRCAPLAAALIGVALLAGCATPEPLPLPERVNEAFDRGRIWQVEGEGIRRSYIFGTYHISDPRVLDIPDAAEQAFAGSPIAAFEYDHDPAKKEQNHIGRERYTLPKGTTLISLIGPSHFGKLKEIIAFRGDWVPRNDINPWIFWDDLGGSLGTFYTNDDESDPSKPVLDEWLQQRARDEGKTVVGLETVEEGFVKYNTIPLDQQAILLGTVLDNYHQRRRGVPTVQFYVDGDLGMIVALWRQGLSFYPPEVAEMLNFRIVTNRNRIMVEHMLDLMAEDSTFVAVGCGHLPGEEGILRLLEQRGYTLTRLQ